jgi:sulfur carrier protein
LKPENLTRRYSEARLGRKCGDDVVKVLLNHPVRELDIPGPKRVKDLLKELALLPESVLVVRGDDLVTEDDTLGDNDLVEIRPVMSGGAIDALP